MTIPLLFGGLTPVSGYLPLYLHNEALWEAEESLPLFTFGSNGNGTFSNLDLFLQCGSDGQSRSGYLPLYLHGPESANLSGYLPLYLSGRNQTAEASLNLFLMQGHSGVQASLNLFVRGSGVTPGYYPHHDALPLWLERNESASLNLYLHGEGTDHSGVLNMFTAGHQGITGSLDMWCSGIGATEASLKMFVAGF